MDDISITGLSPLDVLDISELTTELLTAEQATLTNAAVLQDLTVAGDIIVTGDQVFQGNQEVQKALKVDGNLTAGTIFTHADVTFSNTATAKQGLIVGGNRINLKGDTAPQFVYSLSPSGTPTVNGSWYLWLGNPTGYLGGYDQCQITVTTTGGSAVPSVIPTSIEVEVGGVIMVTQAVNLLREGAVSVLLPTSIFWNPLQEPFMIFATSSTGANWSSISFKFETLPPTYLSIERDPSTNIISYASSYPQRFQVGGSTVATLSAQELQVNGSVNATSLSGNGSQVNNISASNISSGVLPIARGGTNSSVFTANKLVVYSGTANSLISPSSLHWDNTNNRLGIATSAPTSTLDVSGQGRFANSIGIRTNPGTAGLLVGGADAEIALTSSGTNAGSLRFVSSNGLNYIQSGQAYGVSGSSADLVFASMSAANERMRLTAAGALAVQGSISAGGAVTGSGITTTGAVSAGSLTIGGTQINSGWVRSQLAAGTGIGYNVTSGTISNTAPTQWQNVASGISYTTGNVAIGTTSVLAPLHVAISQEGGFDPLITSRFENTWTTNANSNVYTKYKTARTGGEWNVGIDETASFVISNVSQAKSMSILPAGDVKLPNRLWVGDPLYISQTRAFEVGFLADNPITVGAVISNYFNGSNCFIEVKNRNTTNAAAQNTAYFGVDRQGRVAILEENGIQLLSFNPDGLATFQDDIAILANNGAWDTTSGKGIYLRYSTNGTQDEAYIQSITRNTNTLQRMVIQSAELWMGSGYASSTPTLARGKINVFGTAQAIGNAGAHQSFFVSGSDYPTMQLFNFANNNASVMFDAYYDNAWRSSHSGSNFAVYKTGNQLQFLSNSNTAVGSAFSWRRSMAILNSGAILMGTGGTSAVGFLTINDSSVATFFNAGYAALNTAGVGTNGAASSYTLSIYATQLISASAFIAFSDRRIKTNIQELEDGESLALIKRLKPCKYEYIDKVRRGNRQVYGFIAQEVREVLPQAVALQKGVIPNVYNFGKIVSGKLVCEGFDFSGKKVQIFTKENAEQLLAIGEDGAIVWGENETPIEGEVFIIGCEVDDFHHLAKEQLIAPTISAVQELDRKLSKVEEETAALRAQAEEMKQRVQDLEEKNKQLEEAIKTLNGFDVLALTKQVAAMSEALKRKYIL